MQFEINHIYHIYNQGNNTQRIFFSKDNYYFFLRKIQKHIVPYADILAWCLMPNHFHLMVYLKYTSILVKDNITDSKDKYGVKWGVAKNSKQTINKSIAVLLRSYTRAINNQRNRTGSLFRMTTKSKCLTDNSEITPAWFQEKFGTQINMPDPTQSYPQVCFTYIHENPVSANLVKAKSDWILSSYRDYVGLRRGKLINRERAMQFGLEI